MKRSEAEAVINALVKLRESATDEQALAVSVLYPAWREGMDYVTGARVLHDGVLYKVLQDHASQADWTPDNSPSLFTKVIIVDPDVIPEWERPSNENPFMTGDKVTCDGKTWVSNCDNNVWKPGEYGWDEVTE